MTQCKAVNLLNHIEVETENSIKRYKAWNKDIKTWYFAIMLYTNVVL